jgi:hypothetical protein
MFLFDRYYLCLIAFRLRWLVGKPRFTRNSYVGGSFSNNYARRICDRRFPQRHLPATPSVAHRRGAGQTLESHE